MLGTVELRHLRYFAAVAETQNITHAAATLNVAQPSLSRQIRDLEEELGIALLTHAARSVRLTEAGRVFLIEARAVLKRAETAIQTARAVADGQTGSIHVGYAPSLTVELLPSILRLFQQACPGVQIHLHDLSTQEMLRGLRDERLHVALLVQMSAKIMTGLVFEELQQYPVCVAMHPSHPLAKKSEIEMKDIIGERLIAFSLTEYPEHHAWIAGLFARFPSPPRIAEEHDSVTSLIASVEVGRGIALVSQRIECMTGPRLLIRPLVPAPPPLSVGIARRLEDIPPFVTKFIAAARQVKNGEQG